MSLFLHPVVLIRDMNGNFMSPELARSGALAYAEEGWLRIFRIFNLL